MEKKRKKTKRKRSTERRRRRKSRFHDPDEDSILYQIELDLFFECMELDKKRKQGYII